MRKSGEKLMLHRTVSGIICILLLASMFSLAFDVQPAKSNGAMSFMSNQAVDSLAANISQYEQPPMHPLSLPWGDWNHYHNYSEIVNTLVYLNDTYPDIVDLFSIGKSWENRTIYCIKLTNESIAGPKPKLFFVGYHHAREPISAELPLYFVVDAAASFGTNVTITHMLNGSEIYIVVALNVDGLELIKKNDWQRKNAHPYDDDGDGRLDEDPPDDENGDGQIQDLIQWTGSYWTFVRWEGIDDDADGLFNEDWVGGVDLNRNYGYQWNATCDSGSPYPSAEDYRGPAPFSEPETQAIRDFALQHDFGYAVSFHSGAEVILCPWGYVNTPTPHDSLFKEVAADLSALVGAPYEQSAQMYTTSGVWDDWMYGNRSSFALTCEVYVNNSAWQYQPGPYQDSYWEGGILQAFNPDPSQIENVVKRWMPVFANVTERAILEVHDVAATNVVLQKPVVGQGYSLQINVTVTNQGISPETFNITLNATSNSSSLIIGVQTVSNLSRGEVRTLSYNWSDTGSLFGNYTISAVADTIQDETDTFDNTYVGSWVMVTIPGDVDGDFVDGHFDVGLYDAVKLLANYGAKEGSSEYDAVYDIDNDGRIYLYDAVILLGHYGDKYP